MVRFTSSPSAADVWTVAVVTAIIAEPLNKLIRDMFVLEAAIVLVNKIISQILYLSEVSH